MWAFILVGYIKNIQRAKKKGFFIEIEDISGKIEFFVKDPVDLKKFDIVVVHVFKQAWRSANIDKIIRTSRDMLIKQAWEKFNPEITTIKAKLLRLNTDKPERKEELLPPLEIPKKEEKKQEQTVFPVPDTIEKIHILTSIIKNYPWEKSITIWWSTLTISEEGYQKVIDMYTTENTI